MKLELARAGVDVRNKCDIFSALHTAGLTAPESCAVVRLLFSKPCPEHADARGCPSRGSVEELRKRGAKGNHLDLLRAIAGNLFRVAGGKVRGNFKPAEKERTLEALGLLKTDIPLGHLPCNTLSEVECRMLLDTPAGRSFVPDWEHLGTPQRLDGPLAPALPSAASVRAPALGPSVLC